MKLYVVAIRDAAMDEFMNPWTVPAVGMAVRGFGDEVAKEGTPLFAHPEDYELFLIGEFDSQTGALSMQNPQSLARAKDYKPVRS